MKKFLSFLSEGRKKDNLHVAFGAGRFTGVTKEHEKLINNVFSQPAHHHYVFVMGPSTVEDTTEKDPFTVQEKIAHLKKLFPDKADSFIPGDQPHTKSPNQAMAWLYHRHKDDAKKINVSVVAGTGNAGIKGKAAGGSLEAYSDLINRYNKTKFPEHIDETGKKTGGDYRFNFHKVNYVENPRGTISGSVVRKAAAESDPENPEHVENFRQMLHSKMSPDDAKMMMLSMRDRFNRAKNINTVAKTLKRKK